MIQRFVSCAFAVLAFALPISGGAASLPQPPAQILALSHRVIDASNGADTSKYAGLYTSDAVVVDENSPYIWKGANAGVAWFSRVLNVVAAMKGTQFHAASSAPSEFQMQGANAYMIVPVTITAQEKGKPYTEHGTLTYTFRQTSAGWKISSQVWTTKP